MKNDINKNIVVHVYNVIADFIYMLKAEYVNLYGNILIMFK